MGLITINVEEVGSTGIIWLFFTYGFVLFQASNLISEGSDLLLLVPSLAGLVGGVVLPLLGAVPDSAIMLFSGLGDLETAQDNLSVGVGALAGSTIMLLTVSLALSVFAGRVDLDGPGQTPNYLKKPKLNENKSFVDSLFSTGVAIAPEVTSGAVIMMITGISFIIIQIPASFLTQESDDFIEVGQGEKYWALGGLFVTVTSFVSYLFLQYKMSTTGDSFDRMVFEMRKNLDAGTISLRACLAEFFDYRDQVLTDTMREEMNGKSDLGSESQALIEKKVDEKALDLLKMLLKTPFKKYDQDNNKTLDKGEIKALFSDLNEKVDDDFVHKLVTEFDKNDDGHFSFDEFAHAVFETLQSDEFVFPPTESILQAYHQNNARVEEQEEEEEIPLEFVDLPPAEQQKAIKKRAFSMLLVGTTLVVLFSDPMVDVISEIATRTNISAFYVSFTLVPLASNASEIIASQFYARKKTSKSISVSLSALQGAAAMNNTFCLAIFMGLIYFRGLAWEFTAETITILLVEVIVGNFCLSKKLTYFTSVLIMSLFPASIAFVAILEAFGLD